jgi:predicted ester cyclase
VQVVVHGPTRPDRTCFPDTRQTRRGRRGNSTTHRLVPRDPAEGSSLGIATPDLDTLYCQFIDCVNRRRFKDLDRFLAADVVEHGTQRTAGIDAARQTLAGWLVAFPDLHLTIDDLVVDGDRLVARLVLSGTHRDPLAGVAASRGETEVEGHPGPTGRRVRLSQLRG